jgi:hypothetical protein
MSCPTVSGARAVQQRPRQSVVIVEAVVVVAIMVWRWRWWHQQQGGATSREMPTPRKHRPAKTQTILEQVMDRE